jgi:ABC-type dipeptide/oligopeptide/nickel transport system permease subunit
VNEFSENLQQVKLWKVLIQRRSVLFGLITLFIIGFFAIFAPWISSIDPNSIAVRADYCRQVLNTGLVQMNLVVTFLHALFMLEGSL